MGPQAVKTYNGFDLSHEDKRNLGAIIEAFDRYPNGERNETFERFLFNKREQQEGESIDQYLAGAEDSSPVVQLLQLSSRLPDSYLGSKIVEPVSDYYSNSN